MGWVIRELSYRQRQLLVTCSLDPTLTHKELGRIHDYSPNRVSDIFRSKPGREYFAELEDRIVKEMIQHAAIIPIVGALADIIPTGEAHRPKQYTSPAQRRAARGYRRRKRLKEHLERVESGADADPCKDAVS